MKRLFLIYPVIVSAIVLLFTTACKKEEPATKPSLSTTPVTNITTVTATSGGIIANDGGATITVNGVCWGKTENPTIEGLKTTEGVSTGQFVSNLAGLTAGTTYHVRSYATNSVGTSYGANMSFLTLGEAPACLTQAATNTTATGATLNGTVNANDLSTTVTFEYGVTTSYGSTATATQSPVTGNTITNVSVGVSGLLSGTTYHYRVKTLNSIGTTYSEDMTFTTLAQAPTVTTLDVTSKTAISTTLNGTVNANGASTTVTFEYGTTISYGQTVTATQSPVTGNTNTNVSAGITGLTAGTTYHFRVKAVNSVGTTNGSDMTFTTLGLPPTATTLDATNKTTTGSTLNASVNANNSSTVVTFEYGTTTSYGQTVTATQSPVTGNSNTNVSASITGLASGTTYHFRVKAVNSVGTTYGDDKSFTTLYSPPPTSDLVGYWSFSGNANDESGNAHHGTVNGATLTTGRFGNTNSAYYFDGVNDYIAIAPSSLVDNETTATLSFWLKREADDDYGLPVHTGNQGRIQTSVSKNSVSVGVTTNSSYDGSAPTEFGVTDSFNQIQWNHIILRYDGTAQSLSLYINGELKKETFAEGNIWAAQGCYLAFGVYYLFGTPHHGYYKGILDDVRLYKRALNNSEIQSLYHEGGW
jgi:hypothetical protein